MAQWLDRISAHSVYLALDRQDGDPDRFIRYLIPGVRRYFPEFGTYIESLIFSPTLPPPDYLADSLVSALTALKIPLVIVLDDFHAIASEPVQKILIRMIRYLPDNLHLIISTRMDPPLPMAQWRVRNWVSEFRAAELRFTRAEAQDFFSGYFKKTISAEAVDLIANRTEGWAAGLRLALLSLDNAENPEQSARSFSGSGRLIVDFLVGEVLVAQPSEIRSFLYLTAMFERFCAPLCDFILADQPSMDDSRRLIAHLERQNLFLIPLDNEHRWYRYHHFFQNVLMQRFAQNLAPERKIERHRLAGRWFAGQGLIEEALRHLIAAGDLDAAAALLEANMHAAIDNDLSRRTLGRWLNMFPKGAKKGRPALLVAHSFVKTFRWDFAGMISSLDQAESLLKDPACSIPETRRQSLLGDIAVQRGQCLCWQGDPGDGLRHARQGLDLVPKKHRYAHTLAKIYTAAANALCGRKDGALHLLTEALADDCSEGSPNAGQLLVTKIAILSYGADWDAVELSAKKILEIHKTAPQADYWLGYAHYFLGSSAYERNALDAATVHFGRVEQMRYRVNTRLYHDALIGLLLVAWAKEDEDSAEKYAAAAYSYAIAADDPFSMQISNSIQIRRAIFSGDVSADTAHYKPKVDSVRFWLECPSLTHAEYLVNRANHGDCSAGLDCVAKGLQMARHHHNARLEIQFLAVKAVALKCVGRLDQALEVIEKALCLAEQCGLVRTFVDRGPLMAELLKALSEKKPENPYLHRLLDAFAVERSAEKRATISSGKDRRLRSDTAGDEALPAVLSNRELDVLILLQERLSNKEIAQRLFVSPETIKTHISNIYRKLSVNTRRQAVAAARKLNLLPERRRR